MNDDAIVNDATSETHIEFAEVESKDELMNICATHLKTVGDDIYYRQCLAELYYRYQMPEREFPENPFSSIGANFACIFGVTAIGTPTRASSSDGHKFACGVRHISETPIVYSFGSHKQQDFESGILSLRKDAKIFTFELDPNGFPPENEKIKSVEFFNIGLGYPDSPVIFEGVPYMSLRDIMIKLGHSYVDILKIDIEGGEFPFIEKEEKILRRVGQVLIEVHNLNQKKSLAWDPPNKFLDLVKAFERHGHRLFFKELNNLWIRGCEMSFMQADWSHWNNHKQHFRPLTMHENRSLLATMGNNHVFVRNPAAATSAIFILLVLCILVLIRAMAHKGR